MFVLISGMNLKKNGTFDRINRFVESFSPSYLIEKVLKCDVIDRDWWDFNTNPFSVRNFELTVNDQNISIFKERLENMTSIWTEITFVRFFLPSNAKQKRQPVLNQVRLFPLFSHPRKKPGF